MICIDCLLPPSLFPFVSKPIDLIIENLPRRPHQISTTKAQKAHHTSFSRETPKGRNFPPFKIERHSRVTQPPKPNPSNIPTSKRKTAIYQIKTGLTQAPECISATPSSNFSTYSTRQTHVNNCSLLCAYRIGNREQKRTGLNWINLSIGNLPSRYHCIIFGICCSRETPNVSSFWLSKTKNSVRTSHLLRNTIPFNRTHQDASALFSVTGNVSFPLHV